MTKPTSAGQADDALVRLARERFDLPDQVRRLARPPVPSLEPPYGLRVAQLTDAEMLAEWMNRPHLAAAWEYDWPASRWRQHLNAQLEGTYSLPLIGSWHGTDGGYLELYWAAKDLISHYYDADPTIWAARGHRGLVEGQSGLRPAAATADRGQRLCQRAALPADHVRPRSPQHRDPSVV